MTFIKNGKVAENTWLNPADDEDFSGDDAVIISLERWQDQKDSLAGRNGPLGIRLASDQKPENIADDIDRFELIALDIPKLPDGRAFSYARLLRERHNFKGELRAVGKVIQDQLFFMHRCGFDAFELAEGEDVDKSIAALKSFSVAYQPAADDLPPAYRTRHSGH